MRRICPLLGVERTCPEHRGMSAIDPKRTYHLILRLRRTRDYLAADQPVIDLDQCWTGDKKLIGPRSLDRDIWAMKVIQKAVAWITLVLPAAADGGRRTSSSTTTAKAQHRPIVSDDFGYGDSGPYGGGEKRGMPTPTRPAGGRRHAVLVVLRQPSCTPGRAACRPAAFPIAAV